MPRRSRLLAAVCAFVCVATGGTAQAAFDPVYEAKNFSKTQERFTQVVGTPAFQAQLREKGTLRETQAAQIQAADPQRSFAGQLCWQKMDGCAGEVRAYDWSTRGAGLATPVSWVARNGSVISGHVWATAAGPTNRPGAVLTTGSVQAPEELYWATAQALAKAGYVVLTWDVQGQGLSDTNGEGVDRNDGVPSQAGRPFYDGTEDALDFFFSTPTARYVPRPSCTSGTSHADKQQARLAGGLASGYNPFASLVDTSKVGIFGHSLGAGAVSYIGQIDPRVKAIVAYDNLRADTGAAPFACASGSSPRPAAPALTKPALGIANDYGLTPTPFTTEPNPDAKTTASKALSAAGTDTMQLVIRGGTHYESSNIPNPAFGATLRGNDLAAFYTVAWFDRYVRGDEGATARLLTERWRNDAAGAAVDPDRDANDFSMYFKSRVDIARPGGGRAVCESLRDGCPLLAAEGASAPYDLIAEVQARAPAEGPGLNALRAACGVNTTDPVGATGAPAAAATTTCTGGGTPSAPGAPGGTASGPAPGAGAGSAPAPVTGATASCRDRTRPVSRFKRIRLRRSTVLVRGTARDRSCRGAGRVRSVRVSIARSVGKRCRYLRADGRFSRPRSCRRTSYLKAKGTARWTFQTRASFPRGRYKIYVRAIDARGNVERKAKRTFRRVRLR